MYLLKTTFTATPKNKSNFPSTQVWLNGKSKYSLYEILDTSETRYHRLYTFETAAADAKRNEYAYKTRNAAAMKEAIESAEWQNAYGLWNVAVEWVEI